MRWKALGCRTNHRSKAPKQNPFPIWRQHTRYLLSTQNSPLARHAINRLAGQCPMQAGGCSKAGMPAAAAFEHAHAHAHAQSQFLSFSLVDLCDERRTTGVVAPKIILQSPRREPLRRTPRARAPIAPFRPCRPRPNNHVIQLVVVSFFFSSASSGRGPSHLPSTITPADEQTTLRKVCGPCAMPTSED